MKGWWSGLSDQWKQFVTLGAAVVFGMFGMRTIDRVINVPDLVAQTAARLAEVSAIVEHHGREIDARGPTITATYDLARSNAEAINGLATQVGYLICLQEADMAPEAVRRCGISSVTGPPRNDGFER